jgi:glycosyltransferase involved in cell wall biosynthesis
MAANAPDATGSPPAISVVIPTYNRIATLPRAVESVLRQTFTDFELIVVDDCSKDDSAAYLASLTDPRVRVIRHEVNRGGNAARNTGIHAARGELVAFQDSDDEWLIMKLERQLAELAKHRGPRCRAVYCSKIIYGQRGVRDWAARECLFVPSSAFTKVSGDIYEELLDHPMISTQTLMAEKSALAEVGYFDEELKIGQDWDLTTRLARITEYAFVEEPLVMTYVSSDSVSLRRLNAVTTWRKMLDKHYDVISRNPKLHSRNLAEICRIYQREGMWREAQPWARKALGVSLANKRAWGALVLGMAKLATGGGKA